MTGAGRGIGRAIATRLAQDGARVGVHYGASANEARGTVELITAHGGDAFLLQVTLRVDGDAAAMWESFDESAYGVDVLVDHVGMLGPRTPFEDVDERAFDRVWAVNAKAPFFLVQHGLMRLREAGASSTSPPGSPMARAYGTS